MFKNIVFICLFLFLISSCCLKQIRTTGIDYVAKQCSDIAVKCDEYFDRHCERRFDECMQVLEELNSKTKTITEDIKDVKRK